MFRLTAGKFTAQVSPMGGTIDALYYEEHRIIVPERPVIIDGVTHYRGGAFWTVPQFGESKNESWPSPKHGKLRSTLLDVTDLTESAVTFRPEGAAESIDKIVPRVDIAVRENGFSTTLTLRNAWNKESWDERRRPETRRTPDEKRMIPILPAFHPYFLAKKGLEARIDKHLRGRIDNGVRPTAVHGFKSPAEIYPREKREVAVTLTGTGILHMETTCSHVVLWSDNPKDYGCVEPIFGKPGSYGTEEGLWLKPEEEVSYEVNFVFQPFTAHH